MDLLCDAYSNASDDEEQHKRQQQQQQPQPKRQRLSLSSSNPPKPHLPPTPSLSNLQTQPPNPIPGRYVSKRQRALQGPLPSLPDPVPVRTPFPLQSSSTLSVSGTLHFP